MWGEPEVFPVIFLGVEIGDLVYLGVFLGKSKVFTIECLVFLGVTCPRCRFSISLCRCRPNT